MSRSYKIALILKSKSSLPVYKDLAQLSDRELADIGLDRSDIQRVAAGAYNG